MQCWVEVLNVLRDFFEKRKLYLSLNNYCYFMLSVLLLLNVGIYSSYSSVTVIIIILFVFCLYNLHTLKQINN